ncbi:MAG: SPOR domain-containing protein [Desulfobacter sp.]|nr:MAG: SPOR domain-containing protein [Desulfobacter sp.]
MIRILRYISFRFWMVCLAGLPLSFWILPKASAWLPGVPALGVTAVILVLTGLVLGLILDLLGARRIRSLVREGELWERAGMPGRAEKKYLRAMGIFDSAWISPWAARRTGPQLRSAAARFCLTAGICHPGFEHAAILHLLAHPGDETLALLWLGRADLENRREGPVQSVLTALADAHYANPVVRRRLIPKFLMAGRSDFSAQRLYRQFQAGVKAEATPDDMRIAAGIAALVGGDDVAGEINGTRGRGNGLGRTLGDLRNGAGHIPVDRAAGLETTGGKRRQKSLLETGSAVGSVFGRGIKSLSAGILGLVRNKQVQQMIKLGGVGVIGVWLFIFAWTTLSHMVQSAPEPTRRIEIKIRKPYTIQVAAYLKPAHADRYVAQLEKKGIRATVKKTGAGGKTWYLVRVSEFTDKKAAADYGNRLKSQKIIEDFFVSNK